MLEDGKLDEVVKLRTEAMREQMNTELTKAKKRSEEYEGQLRDARTALGRREIEDNVRRAFASKKLRLQPGADQLVMAQAFNSFVVGEDGKPQPAEGKYGVDGEDLNFETFVDQIADSHSYLIEGSQGGGAQGGRGGAKRSGKLEVPQSRSNELTKEEVDAFAAGKATFVDG